MNTEKVLLDIGMTKNEVKVYLALLKLGFSKVGKISKEAETNRSYTYDALKKLLEKGLISYVITGKRKWFKPADPKRLVAFLRERESDVEEILPQLEGVYKQTEPEYNVTLYKGLKGVKTVFEDIIQEGKPNAVFGSEGEFVKRLDIFSKHFTKQIEKKNIKIRNIVQRGVDIKPSKTTEVRFVPKKVRSPVVTNIYGDKIAIIIWTDVPEAVLIKNKSAAESYRNYFEILWKSASRK